MAAIKDVAKLAGMSVAVVSKYLKNPDSVRKDTLEKIQSAIKQLNYVPSPIARSLRTKRTGMIAVVVPSITNPFFAELFDFIRQDCISKSYMAVLQTAENDFEMKATLNSIISRQFDGVVFCFLDNEKIISELKQVAPHIPSTVMNWHGMDNNSRNIILDVRQGIYEATSYLIDKGCKRIGYIGGPEESTISREKFKGYLDSLEKHELHYLSNPDTTKSKDNSANNTNPKMVKKGKQTMKFGFDAMKEIYESNNKVDGVVCENDAFAIGCLTYCLHESLKVPSQIMITGFDDIPLAKMFQPSLTTVRFPLEEMAQCAVEMIFSQLDEKTNIKSNIKAIIDTNIYAITDINNMEIEAEIIAGTNACKNCVSRVFDTQLIIRETTL